MSASLSDYRKETLKVDSFESSRILLILIGTKSSQVTKLDPLQRRKSVLWCPNEARGDFYRVSWPGCRETDGPVIVAEARIGEFGSSASRKMMPFSGGEGGREKSENRKKLKLIYIDAK